MEFQESRAEHFTSISREPPPHVLIERALIQIAGDGDAAKFRNEVLAAAGWKHSNLISFGKYPDQAASAFNRIRAVLAQTQDKGAVMASLGGG